jgi:hypothetical protein
LSIPVSLLLSISSCECCFQTRRPPFAEVSPFLAEPIRLLSPYSEDLSIMLVSEE